MKKGKYIINGMLADEIPGKPGVYQVESTEDKINVPTILGRCYPVPCCAICHKKITTSEYADIEYVQTATKDTKFYHKKCLRKIYGLKAK